MATTTIASGETLSLIQPLATGTNVEFLNDVNDSGLLTLQPEAIDITTVTNDGVPTFVSATLGGEILNFQPGDGSQLEPGDDILLMNFNSFYSEMNFGADAAAENASFALQATLAAQSGVQIFIEPGGIVTTSVNAPPGFTLDAATEVIINEIETSLFGTAAADATVALSFGLRTNPNSDHPFVDALVTSETAINPCFTPGTMILTVAGDMKVEALRPGDLVITFAGEEREVIWVGQRDIDICRHKRPETVWPVIIEPSAFDERVPERRLVLSPDHALYIDGVLVQAKDLVNDETIRWDRAARFVRYHHVELTAHDILFAENAPAESYLDTGHRGLFDGENAKCPPQAVMQWKRETLSCAPLCVDRDMLALIRLRLARRRGHFDQARAASPPWPPVLSKTPPARQG